MQFQKGQLRTKILPCCRSLLCTTFCCSCKVFIYIELFSRHKVGCDNSFLRCCSCSPAWGSIVLEQFEPFQRVPQNPAFCTQQAPGYLCTAQPAALLLGTVTRLPSFPPSLSLPPCLTEGDFCKLKSLEIKLESSGSTGGLSADCLTATCFGLLQGAFGFHPHCIFLGLACAGLL